LPKDVDEETSCALDKVKSPDAAVRAEAVRELVGVREAVADELERIVSEANQNPPAAHPAAKLIALSQMGRWGLVQCADVLEAEKDWTGGRRWPTTPDRFSPYQRFSLEGMGDLGARGALQRLRTGTGIKATSSGVKADLSDYPVLKKAFADLRSYDNETFLGGATALSLWYDCVCRSLENMLTFNDTHLYADDVKVSAIYLAGEYRILGSGALDENIDVRDDKGQTAGYPSALTVDTADAEYPAAVAMVKCGRRMDFEQLITEIIDEKCSQAGRERIARAMMTIDPVAAKTELGKRRESISHLTQTRYGTPSDVLARLSSVAGIIK
jgi:hypothetical protein